MSFLLVHREASNTVQYLILPYIILNIIVVVELAAILYVTNKNQSEEAPKKLPKKDRKQKTFNGFYVDR